MSNRVEVQVTGAKELTDKLKELARDYPRAMAAALYQEGLGVDLEMVRRIPVDTGRLRATHYVAPPSPSDTELVCEVGVSTNYAIPVHERTDVHHNVGEAKFLENAVTARLPGFAVRLGASIDENVRRGVGIGAVSGAGVPTRPQDNGDKGPSSPGRRGRGRGR